MSSIKNSLVLRFNSWFSRHCFSTQWQIDRHNIQQQRYAGLRPRLLISRELCQYTSIDFAKIPANKRSQALQQQLGLLSPFVEPGHFVFWQGSRAQLWLWDRAALSQRVPVSNGTMMPDSVLSLAMPLLEGERYVEGVQGSEWQRWRNNQLIDSRWQPATPSAVNSLTLNLGQRSPLQAVDRASLQQLALILASGLLLIGLLLQAGGLLSLHQQQQQLQQQLSDLVDDNQLQAQARRRSQQARKLWQARQSLLSASQSNLIAQLGQVLPDSAGLWQRYDFQPSRVQIFLRDPNPDPRDYVTRIGGTGLLNEVQVQPETNGMVTLQATPVSQGQGQ